MRKRHLPFLVAILISSCFSLKSQSNLWGVTTNGGNGSGSLFSLPTGNTAFATQYNFTDNAGTSPVATKMLEVSGKLYGTTNTGGSNNQGVIFEYDPVLNIYTKKMDFGFTATGSQPAGSLIQASSNGKLYGLAKIGAAGFGCIYEYVPATNSYSVVTVFTGTTGAAMGSQPTGALLEASNGKLYGMTSRGGTGGGALGTGQGVIFEFNPANGAYAVLTSFTGTTGAVMGSAPLGSLIEPVLGTLYGITSTGGASTNFGVIFKYDINTTTYTKLVDLTGSSGAAPGNASQGSLLRASNGKLYGLTSSGGTGNLGVLFEFDPAVPSYSVASNLVAASGSGPFSTLMQASNGKLYGTTRVGGTSNVGTLFEYDIASGTYTKKTDMVALTNGSLPQSSLVQFSGNSKLYGMTQQGGTNGGGVIFEYDPATNTYVKKIDFNNSTGGQPNGAPVLANNNKLYGFAAQGGTITSNGGVIYEYDPATTTYVKKADMTTTNGRFGYGSLVQYTNNILYGLMSAGGTSSIGSIVQYVPGATTYSKLLDFNGTNGSMPYGSVVTATNGNVYGLTSAGGTNGLGVLFEYNINTNTYTVKYHFTAADGANPYGSLFIASNGKAYGLTSAGGANGLGVIFEYDITANTYTKKIDMTAAGGSMPYGSLVQANGNFLYGMTRLGGTNSVGVIFEYNITNGTYAKKVDLSATTGNLPYGSLTKTAGGKLYGMTSAGGANNVGTMFEYDPATITFTKKMDLSVTTGGAPGYTQLLEVCTLPSAASAITATTNALCRTDAVSRNFSITTIANATSYTWTVPAGAIITSGATSNSVNINFGPLAAGVYTVSGGGSNVCGTGTLSAKTITVNALPTITVNSGTICSGITFTIVPSGASSYTIEGGSANVAPNTSTNYTVMGTDGNGCVSASPATSTVVVNNTPVISVNSGTICNGSSFTFSPTGATSYTYEGGNAVVSPNTTTTYTVSGSTGNGCTSSAVTSTVTVYNHPTIAAASGSMCSGSTFTISPSGANTYAVTGGNFNVSPNTTTNYTVTGTSIEGCSSANDVTVTVTVETTPTIGVNSGTICAGNSFTINPNGANSYTISGNAFIVSPTTNTSYVVIGSSPGGCISNAAISTITVYALPFVTATSGTLCSGNSYSITPGGANSYIITGNNFLVSPATTTNYFVTGTSAQGCPSSNTATATVTVYTTPTVGVNSGSICSGNPFTVTPTGAAIYTISGTVTGSPLIMSPTTNTSYIVTGQSIQGCLALNTATSVVTVSLTPTVTATSGTICSGGSFSITPGGASVYTVQGGNFVVFPTTTSTYTLIGKAGNGCISANTATSTVVVNPNPTINVNSGSVCSGSQFTITPTGGDSYTVSGNNLIVSPTTNTFYTVTGSLLGCPGVNTATATITINALPVITVSTSTICAGQTATLIASGGVNYTWTPSASGATINPSPLIDTPYSVTGTDASGCSASVTKTVVVNPLPSILVASGAVCPGESFTLAPSGAVTYTYSGGSAIVTPVATTDYSVTGTDANGCTSTLSAVASITVTSVLPVSISGLGSVCAGQPVVLTAGGASTYSWSTGAATSTISVAPSTVTGYTVVGSSGSCSNIATFTVSTISLPNIQVSTSAPTICIGQTATLTAAGGTTYTWTPGNQNVSAIVVSPLVTTVYVLRGADASCTNSVSFTQNVSTCDGVEAITNNEAIFSVYPNPNNGEFSVEVQKSMTISILNTLGSVILTQQLEAGKNTISMDKQAKGIYFVQAVYNKQVKTVRVAVQ